MVVARPLYLVTLSLLLLGMLSSAQARRAKPSRSQLEARQTKLDLSKYHVPLSNGEFLPVDGCAVCPQPRLFLTARTDC